MQLILFSPALSTCVHCSSYLYVSTTPMCSIQNEKRHAVHRNGLRRWPYQKQKARASLREKERFLSFGSCDWRLCIPHLASGSNCQTCSCRSVREHFSGYCARRPGSFLSNSVPARYLSPSCSPQCGRYQQRFPFWECRPDCWITEGASTPFIAHSRGAVLLFSLLLCVLFFVHFFVIGIFLRYTARHEQGSAADAGDPSMRPSTLAF